MAEKYETFSIESGDFSTTFNRSFKERKGWGKRDDKHILSFMPGMVIEYCVKVGDKVKRGDRLMLFKAMKMDNIIASPIDGTIKSLNAEVGTNVPKNTLLIEIE